MERFYKYMVLLAFAAVLYTSCQEGGEAGSLFGQWRLMDADGKYVSFSGSVCLFRNAGRREVYGQFRHSGDSLFIQCVSVRQDPADTLLVENDFGFSPFTDIRLKIDRLDGDNLVVSRGDRKWSFCLY